MKLGPRELLFLLLLTAMPAAAYRFVFEPRNEQIAQAQQQIAQKRSKLDRLRQATRRMDDLGRQIDRLSQAVILFEQKLPAQREVEVVLGEVWELATRRGLNPQSVRTDRAVVDDHYAELPLKMMIVGDFDGFYEFLLDLERLERITRLPKMKLERLPQTNGQVSADLVLSIFYETAQPAPNDESSAI